MCLAKWPCCPCVTLAALHAEEHSHLWLCCDIKNAEHLPWMLPSVAAAWIEAAWAVGGWLRPGKVPKVLPFQSFTSAGMLKTLRGSSLYLPSVECCWNFRAFYVSVSIPEPGGAMRVPGIHVLLWGQSRRSSLIPTVQVRDCSAVQCCPRKVTVTFMLLEILEHVWSLWLGNKWQFCRV